MSLPRGRSGVRVPCSPLRGGNGNSTHITRGGTAGNPHGNWPEQPGTGRGNTLFPKTREQVVGTALGCVEKTLIHIRPFRTVTPFLGLLNAPEKGREDNGTFLALRKALRHNGFQGLGHTVDT